MYDVIKYFFQDKKTIMIITIGSLLSVIGINIFLTPLDVYPTGLMGISFELSTLIKYVLPDINEDKLKGIIYFILNIPLIIISWKKVGKKFTVKTLLVVTLISLFTSIIPIPEVSPITEPTLSILACGIISGFGLALLLNVGTSTGGFDILALYFSLIKKKSFGRYNLLLNSVVIIIAIIISRDITDAVYMLILVYTISTVINKVHITSDEYTLFVVTSKAKEVKKHLYESNVYRGITIIDSAGGYSEQENKTLMITCENDELILLSTLINEKDDKAFINIFRTYQVHGEFERTYKNKL